MITSFDKLNLAKFSEIQQIVKEGGDWQEMNLRIVSVLSDISVEELCRMPITQVSALIVQARFLDAPIGEEKIAKRYKIGEFELIPCFDVSKFTTAQYVDFQEFMKAPDDNQIGILSCILVPRGCKYNTDYDIEAVKKSIAENISVTTSTSLFTFFFVRLRNLIVSSLNSSEEAVRTLQPATEEEKNKKKIAQERISEALHILGFGDGLPA